MYKLRPNCLMKVDATRFAYRMLYLTREAPLVAAADLACRLLLRVDNVCDNRTTFDAAVYHYTGCISLSSAKEIIRSNL